MADIPLPDVVDGGTTVTTNTIGHDAINKVIYVKRAPALNTTTGLVDVSASAAPSSGQTLVATGATTATWQTPSVAIANVTGLGAGVATFLTTPTSANLAAAVTGETGTGNLVFHNGPTFVAPLLGTPASGVLTNTTGYQISNLTGAGANVLALLASFTSANLAAALTDETGTGAAVFATSPTLVTPALGTPASGVLSSCTGRVNANQTADQIATSGSPVVISSTAPTSGQNLQATGTATAAWVSPPTSLPPNGSAGGDLGGTYPNPTVTQARGLKSATTTVDVASATAPTSGQVLTATGGSAATWQSPATSLPPNGSAGGDLGGTYPNPTVTRTSAIKSATTDVSVGSATAPTTGQILTAINSTSASWQTPAGGPPTGSAGGSLSGTYPNPVVEDTKGVKSATTTVNTASATAPSAGQALIATGGSAATWQSPSTDLGGTWSAPTVLQARGLKSATTLVDVASATAPTSGQVLTATSGTAATWQTPSGGAPSGSAGGDLGGTYPNPDVVRAQGLENATTTVSTLAAAAPSSGQVLTATASTTATWQTPVLSSSGFSTGDRATWNGSTFVPKFGGGQELTATSSNLTTSNVTYLSVTVPRAGTYRFSINTIWNRPNATSSNCTVTLLCSNMTRNVVNGYQGTGDCSNGTFMGGNGTTTFSTNQAIASGPQGTAANRMTVLSGSFTTSASGLFEVQYAVTAAGSNTTLRAGSYVVVDEI